MHEPLAIPPETGLLGDGWTTTLAYSHVAETATWRAERDRDVRFVKVAVAGRQPTLADERDRLAWAAGRLPVPVVLGYGATDGAEWLITRGLPGRDATHPDLRADPASLVPILAEGLRAFHEAPADGCPFDSRLDAALAHVRRRVASGLVDAQRDFHDQFRHLTPAMALEFLETHRPTEREPVLCHRDYCLPNALIEDGRVTGYLDLGELGVADRWCDLAVATWSVTWNLGPGWEETFLRAYGAEPDVERTVFYRLLYDLAS